MVVERGGCAGGVRRRQRRRCLVRRWFSVGCGCGGMVEVRV
jgi:hypothetical protein